MKRDTNKQIDDLFKDSLAEPQHIVAHREEEWDALEQRLDAAQRKRVIPLWWPMSAAAVMLIAFSLWMLAPQTVKQQQQPQVASVKKDKSLQTEAVANNPSSTPATANKFIVPPTGRVRRQFQNNYVAAKSTNGQMTVVVNNPTPPAQIAANTPPVETATTEQAIVNSGQTVAGTVTEQTNIAANADQPKVATSPVLNTTGTDSIAQQNTTTRTIASINPKINTSSGFRPQYALSFMGAPEINGLGTMLNVRTGVNVGILVSASVKRFKLSTGASYALKQYGSSYDPWGFMGLGLGYSQSKANSQLIDLPLNLDYQLYNRAQNKFSVGAGVSSYILLSQNYQYDYIDNEYSPEVVHINSTDRYFLSTLNLQATYTRQLNAKFGLSFQPYFKLPLRQIGDSRSKLQTAGFAVGVNWNLNTLKKR